MLSGSRVRRMRRWTRSASDVVLLSNCQRHVPQTLSPEEPSSHPLLPHPHQLGPLPEEQGGQRRRRRQQQQEQSQRVAQEVSMETREDLLVSRLGAPLDEGTIQECQLERSNTAVSPVKEGWLRRLRRGLRGATSSASTTPTTTPSPRRRRANTASSVSVSKETASMMGTTVSSTSRHQPKPNNSARASVSSTREAIGADDITDGIESHVDAVEEEEQEQEGHVSKMSKEGTTMATTTTTTTSTTTTSTSTTAPSSSSPSPSFHSATSTSTVTRSKSGLARAAPLLLPMVVHVELRRGLHLAARDSSGTSDPYVKFFVNNRLVYKSRTCYKDLNPVWDEKFVVEIESNEDKEQLSLDVKVFDYDWAFRDDFIGESSVSLDTLETNTWHELSLELLDANAPIDEHLGHVDLVLLLEPLLHQEVSSTRRLSSHSQHSFSTLASTLDNSKSRSSPWLAVVHVLLVEAKNLSACNTDATTDAYCKFKLANERYKSRPIYQTSNPKWVDQFDLYLFNENQTLLEITVCDKDRKSKDEALGKCNVDVANLEQEKTHDLWLSLGDEAGSLRLLVTITGLTVFDKVDETDNDTNNNNDDDNNNTNNLHLTNHSIDPPKGLLSSGVQWLPWRASSDPSLSPVSRRPRAKPGSPQCVLGRLEVVVVSARGLHAADLGGRSDPFAVIELDNERRQTHTEYKTVSPDWGRKFVFDIKDIHSDLVITIFDENRHHSYEFLGKLVLPLLSLSSGHRLWYALKDKRLRERAKGVDPRLLMRARLHWSPYLAAIRTINPKEEKLMQPNDKFKRHIFITNVMRLKCLIMELVAFGSFVDSCFSWQYPARSFLALVVFVVSVWYFEPYMLPMLLLLVFVRGLVLDPDGQQARDAASIVHEIDEDEHNLNTDDKESRKSIKAKLQQVQEVSATVQNAIGFAASLGESVKNTFNFSVPFLSYLAIVALIVATVLLYMVSLRVVILVWGINKFSKKLINPLYVDNNELIDFLSRVPSDERLLDHRPIRATATNENTNDVNKDRKKGK